MSSTFTERVLELVRQIPAGQTKTYKEVATIAGNPRAARAVGTILHHVWQSDHGQTIPCHRVIRSDGSFGGYAAGAAVKEHKLREERARIHADD